MDINIYSVSAVVLVGIITEIIKRLGVPNKFLPLISIISGVLVVCFGSWGLSPELVFAGIVVGATASGVYDNIVKGKDIILVK